MKRFSFMLLSSLSILTAFTPAKADQEEIGSYLNYSTNFNPTLNFCVNFEDCSYKEEDFSSQWLKFEDSSLSFAPKATLEEIEQSKQNSSAKVEEKPSFFTRMFGKFKEQVKKETQPLVSYLTSESPYWKAVKAEPITALATGAGYIMNGVFKIGEGVVNLLKLKPLVAGECFLDSGMEIGKGIVNEVAGATAFVMKYPLASLTLGAAAYVTSYYPAFAYQGAGIVGSAVGYPLELACPYTKTSSTLWNILAKSSCLGGQGIEAVIASVPTFLRAISIVPSGALKMVAWSLGVK